MKIETHKTKKRKLQNGSQGFSLKGATKKEFNKIFKFTKYNFINLGPYL